MIDQANLERPNSVDVFRLAVKQSTGFGRLDPRQYYDRAGLCIVCTRARYIATTDYIRQSSIHVLSKPRRHVGIRNASGECKDQPR